MSIHDLNQPVNVASLSAEERLDVLRKAHRYLCNIQTGGALNDRTKQAELFAEFFPTFHALVLDGAVLVIPLP